MTDKHEWLEDVLSEQSLDWVKAHNKRTTDHFSAEPGFNELVSSIQEILESKEKLPFVNVFNKGMVYNVWTDEVQIQGLIRRTTVEDYQKAQPNWETVLDLDVLSQKEGETWVYHGIDISPNGERALISLSPGGSDADTIREFDLKSKSFIEDGFSFSLSKGAATWFENDTLCVTREFGENSLTSSGYPRILNMWKRGSLVPSGKPLFEAQVEDLSVYASTVNEGEKSIALIQRSLDFYNAELFLYDGRNSEKLDCPKQFHTFGINLDMALMSFKENWNEFLSGDIISYHFTTKKFTLIYRPTPRTSVDTAGIAKDGVYLVIDEDVKGSLYFFSLSKNKWTGRKVELPTSGTIHGLVTDYDSLDFFVDYESFNMPTTIYYSNKNKELKAIKTQPSYFNHKDVEVNQHFVKSLDGTMVPYFLIHKKGLSLNSKNPTILYGYGGFEVSMKPWFSNMMGRVWLDKGGVYVLGNIRGGGEYGPSWHQAALKDKRDRAYEDFFAIAEDLIAKNITAPKHLGAMGGSNGGLLMGVCFTRRPELFSAINCGVPLLDMHRYHKLLAGNSWVAEYGNPDDEVDGSYIRKLSPYHNIDERQKNYPQIYINTSTKDDRVHPGHARKFGAKLEEFNIPFHYQENINGGHAGFANLTELAFLRALDYAFFWKYLK